MDSDDWKAIALAGIAATVEIALIIGAILTDNFHMLWVL